MTGEYHILERIIICEMATKLKARHILELSVKEQKDFLDSFDFVLSDCDGVMWLIIHPIPRTGDAINLLKAAGKKCKFVSNNSIRTDDEYLRKFQAIGVQNMEKADIMHPVKLMVRYLKTHKPGERVFSLCSLEANEVLRANGIAIETLEVKEHVTPVALGQMLAVKEKEVGAVLIDINLDLNYSQLARACQYLLLENCDLISGGTDRLLPVSSNLIAPGFVGFAQYLRDYSKKEPIVLGKPSPLLGDLLKNMFNIDQPKRCLFVGDALQQDIEFGSQNGFQTLLVLSGFSTKEDMHAAKEELKPDYYADSLPDFIQLFKNIEHESN